MKSLITLFIIALSSAAYSQEILEQKFQEDQQERSYDGEYAFSNKGLAQIALTSYQKIISPQLNSECLYTTSCSRYSRAAINKHGIFKGVFMTGDRLTRCNRFILKHVHEHEVVDGAIVDEP